MISKFGPIPPEMRFPKSDTTRFIGTTGIESSTKGAFSRYSRQNLPKNYFELLLALLHDLSLAAKRHRVEKITRLENERGGVISTPPLGFHQILF